MRKAILFIFSALLGLYILANGYLYSTQDNQIYTQRVNRIEIAELPNYAINLKTAGGIILSGVQLPSQKEDAPIILTFGGNAHDVTGLAHFLWKDVFEQQAGVVGISYRGYPNAVGQSGGVPNQKALEQDALQIYDMFSQENRPVYTVGYSLGTYFATYVASQRDVAGVGLIAPFASMLKMATDKYPYMLVKPLLKSPLRTDELLKGVKAPVHIFVAGQDGLIPDTHPLILKEKVKQLATYKVLTHATHNNVLHEPKLVLSLRELLNKDDVGH
ncbi:MAG: alpha/beta hydrolase [Alphaproteobacteria bacterium]|nr:alpha/beta hydrolase [Alphaproteobacteria bacterium]